MPFNAGLGDLVPSGIALLVQVIVLLNWPKAGRMECQLPSNAESLSEGRQALSSYQAVDADVRLGVSLVRARPFRSYKPGI